MKTGIDEHQEVFRAIDLAFLRSDGAEVFDIFYKTESFGNTQYVKFASSHPSHQSKVRRLIEDGVSTQEFFIREEDLGKYHGQATKALRTMISNPEIPFEEKTRKIYDVSKGIMKDFFDSNASQKILQSSEEVMEIMEKCLSGNEAGFHSISMITNKDYYTYTHSVNVGLYCMSYGIKTKMGANDTKDLGVGGMFHDLGKAKIDASLINKNGKLTDGEFETIKSHPLLGSEILKSMKCYGNNVIRMANEHHEKFTGNGYPKGLVGEEISRFARICKVMDVYDALTTRRSYKKAMNPFDALTLMGKQMVDEFDRDILGNFVRYMGPELQ
jgi:HD-GYP domain-containing protein (c-di-GMP phosphodiesterase class II)